MQIKTSSGERLFDTVQATFNLLEQSAGPALLEAKQLGMDIIVKEAMANGRLTDRNTAAAFAPKLSKLSESASSLGTTVDALALACVMCQPFKPMVLSGAATTEHLQSNAKAVDLAQKLDMDLVHDLMQTCVMDPKAYWDERSALSWN